MKARSFLTVVLMVSLAVGLPRLAPAQPQDPPDKPETEKEKKPPESRIEGVVSGGSNFTDNNRNVTRVGEYDVLQQGTLPRVGAAFWGNWRKVHFDVLAEHSGDAQDQKYRMEVDFNRYVRAHVRYDRVPHWLDHDPLTYQDAAVQVFVIRHDDTDPFALYRQTRGELDAKTEIVFPAWKALRFHLGYREETRDGFHEAVATSKCANCHTVAKTQLVNQDNRDMSAGLRLQLKRLTVDYTYTNRIFQEKAPTPLNVYDNAVQPVTLANVFGNRVQYDDGNGPLPFSRVPGVRKDSHVLKARLDFPRDISMTGNYVHSQVRNLDTQLGIDSSGWGSRLVVPLGRRMTFRAGLRHYDIDSDDVFVDVVEPVSVAGPEAGRTYAQAYGLTTFDFTRFSSLSRSPTEGFLDFTLRPFKRTTLRLGYEREVLDRDFFEVERTTTDTFKLSVRSRPRKDLNFRFLFQRDWIDDPFTLRRAAVPLVLQPFPTPGAVPFGGLQYFQMYASRQADLTSLPTGSKLVEESVTWSPSQRFSFTGHYRWRDDTNNDLNFSDWSRTVHLPGAEVWIAPSDRWNLTLGYTYHRERSETLFSTLNFVG
ncbi:MAG TPA: GSU2204 family CXXCH-containing (seleno)protein [Candidatus Xenobia bacterium]|nr:GSU2204 family CXXCH-containing (seleno)protein [Candidatus Xenobia bacterium]